MQCRGVCRANLLSLGVSTFRGSFSDDEIVELADGLKFSSSLQELSIRDAGASLTSSAVVALFDAVKLHGTILSFACLSVQDDDAFFSLCSLVKVNTSLNHVAISLGYKPENIKLLSQALEHNYFITSFDVEDDDFNQFSKIRVYVDEVCARNKAFCDANDSTALKRLKNGPCADETIIFVDNVLSGKLFEVQAMLDKIPALAGIVDVNGSVLSQAIERKHCDIVRAIVQSPYFQNDSEAIQRLIDIEIFCGAVTNNNIEIINLLLEAGYRVLNDRTLLAHIVSNDEYLKIARLLIENGANPNELSEDGESLLYIAAQHLQPELVDYLSSLDAIDCNFVYEEDMYTIPMAIVSSLFLRPITVDPDCKILARFLEIAIYRGLDINVCPSDDSRGIPGTTVLNLLFVFFNTDNEQLDSKLLKALSVLLSFGADASIANDDGDSAFEQAKAITNECTQSAVLAVLQQYVKHN